MNDCKLGAVESRFADLIWQNEPIASTALVKLAEQELSWKKSTTYTVLKRLSQRGIFQNQDGTVTSLLSREAFYAGTERTVCGGNLLRLPPRVPHRVHHQKKVVKG